jgi:hypothetical protein
MSIAIGLKDIDLRYDAIDLAFIPQEILGSDGVDNGEVHEAILIPGLGGKVGFSPNEMPERNSLANSGIILYEVDASNVPIGSPLTQVTPAVGFNPGLTEYFVDIRNPLAFLNTGRFYLNPANVGKFYRIQRYFGLGGLNNVANQKFILDSVLAEKFNKDGSLAMTGDLDLGGFKGINAIAGVNPSDLVIFSQIGNTVWIASGVTPVSPTPEIVTVPSAGNWFFIVKCNDLTASVSGGVSILSDPPSHFGITSTSVNIVATSYVAIYDIIGFKLA